MRFDVKEVATMGKYKYYGVRGSARYVHAECWKAYEVAHSRYDTQGRLMSRPTYNSQLQTFRGIRQHRCLHCDRPLLSKPPEFGERCRQVAIADPIGDFAQELVAQEMTEIQLQHALSEQPLLTGPFKTALLNRMRDKRN